MSVLPPSSGLPSKSHQSPSPWERLFRAQWEPELSRFLDHFTFLLCIARRIETAVPKPLSHKMNTSPWARIKLHYHTLVRRALSLRKCAKNAACFARNEWVRCSRAPIWWDCCACEESGGSWGFLWVSVCVRKYGFDEKCIWRFLFLQTGTAKETSDLRNPHFTRKYNIYVYFQNQNFVIKKYIYAFAS